MIRLGHIEYSNCLPVHARLLALGPPADVELTVGVPAALNRALANGEIDAAPCSSIEYARHADEYFVMPDFVIGSDGPVQSIRFDCAVDPAALREADVVHVTDSSATSVALLRILLARHWGVSPRFESFDQTADDPLRRGGTAALFIGDVALRRPWTTTPHCFDLGEVWKVWTGLPFAFAVWQVRRDLDPAEAERLHALLLESRAWFHANEAVLAERYAPQYRIDPHTLRHYWQSLRYDLDPRMQEGLLRFLSLAAELGEAPPLSHISFADPLRNQRATR